MILPTEPSAYEAILHTPPPVEVEPKAKATDRSSVKTIAQLQIALVTAVVLIVILVVLLLARPFGLRTHAENLANLNPLWKEFMAGVSTKTVVVSADSGLVMFQHLTGQRFRWLRILAANISSMPPRRLFPEEIVRKFGMRRYTPAVDLSVLDRTTRIFGERRDRLSFHYARDLRIQDLKEGNAILLGSSESNPWVQLFEPSMNFLFQDDLLHDRAQMINRHPLPGEAMHYDSTPQDPSPTIYGLVAYRPNLNKSGHVLILEGQTMAGTQTAADFLFDNSYILPFLKRIERKDGTIPYFELLLRSSSLGGRVLGSNQWHIVLRKSERYKPYP